MKNSFLFLKNLFSFFSILFPALMILVSGCGKKEVPLKPQGKPETPQQTVTSSENSRANVSNDDNGAEDEMPVFKMHNNEELKVQKVEDDRSNIQVRKREESETKIKDDTTPADSLAGQLGVSDKVVTWKPKWFFEGAGGPRLPVCTLSEDGSVFLIVERTGKSNGPNGSRILLYNTYSWEIIGLREFPEDKISFVKLIPNTLLAAVFSEKQESSNKSAKLSVFNLKSGGEVLKYDSIKDKITDMASWGDKLLLKTSGKTPEIICLPIDKDRGETLKAASENSGGVFTILDSSTAALAGERAIEIFDAGLKIVSKIQCSYEKGYCPENAAFCGENDKIAVSAYMGKAYFFNNGKVSEICNSSGRILEFNGVGLILEKYVANRVVLMEIPSLQEKFSVNPSESKPGTRGYPVFFREVKHLGKYLAFDSSGNLYVMKQPMKNKKWKKEIIFQAK